VADVGSAVVAGGEFEVTGTVLSDHAYTIGYYADISGDGACQSAPADHVWQENVPAVTADVDLAVTHNTDFKAVHHGAVITG